MQLFDNVNARGPVMFIHHRPVDGINQNLGQNGAGLRLVPAGFIGIQPSRPLPSTLLLASPFFFFFFFSSD